VMDQEVDPTKQLGLKLRENSINNLQQVINLIQIYEKQRPEKHKDIYVNHISIQPQQYQQFFLTFNKTKGAIVFYESLTSPEQETLHQLIESVEFTQVPWGSYDKKQPKTTRDYFLTQCYNDPIVEIEIFAIEEVWKIFGELIQIHNLPENSLEAISMSLGKGGLYLTFSSCEIGEQIFRIIQNPSWISPRKTQGFPLTGDRHWKLSRVNSVAIIPHSKCSLAHQLYYSTKYAKLIPGLLFHPEILTPEEESQLLQWIDRDDYQFWQVGQEGKTKPMNRRVQHYGFRFNYSTLLVDEPQNFIPEIFQPIIKRLLEIGFLSSEPNQITINEYLPGQGILAHVDTHSAFEDRIVSVSLGSDIGMEFSRCAAPKNKLGVYLPARSVICFSEESRYAWKHGITKKTHDHLVKDLEEYQDPFNRSLVEIFFPETNLVKRERRVSITFRVVNRENKCSCRWKEFCDSQTAVKSSGNVAQEIPVSIPENMIKSLADDDNSFAKQLEQKHVFEFYETAAEHFSNTRHSPWPQIARFLTMRTFGKDLKPFEGLSEGMWVADIGCGNGKYLRCIPSSVRKNLETLPVYAVGSDISFNLLQQSRIAGGHDHDLFVADGLELPLRDQLFDVVICIAVFHHISTLSRRLQLARELLRILKVNGRLLVYAWAFEQEQGAVGSRKFPEQDCFVPWHLSKKYAPASEENHPGDGEDLILQRFCHVFREGELEELFAEASNHSATVLRSYNDHSNWAVILQKNQEKS